jgi:hypothetical protein
VVTDEHIDVGLVSARLVDLMDPHETESRVVYQLCLPCTSLHVSHEPSNYT